MILFNKKGGRNAISLALTSISSINILLLGADKSAAPKSIQYAGAYNLLMPGHLGVRIGGS